MKRVLKIIAEFIGVVIFGPIVALVMAAIVTFGAPDWMTGPTIANRQWYSTLTFITLTLAIWVYAIRALVKSIRSGKDELDTS